MTASITFSDPAEDDPSTQSPIQYQYDIRLEIGVKKPGETVPVVAIFHDLVKRMKKVVDENSPIIILTATDKLFFEEKEMTSDDFQKAFHVDHTEGKNSKVILGFKMRTMTRLSEIKKRLMHTYLIPNNMFLREHTGGFDHGVKTYGYGFLKHDHPDHPDVYALKQRFARLLAEAWKTLDSDDKKKWRDDFSNVLFGKNGIILPINFTKEKVTAVSDDKEKLATFVLMVSTPNKYGKLLKTLLDIAVLGKKINNLIPFAFSRENPEGYYLLMAHQARFIDNHRNIPLMNIPADANTKLGNKGKTLFTILSGNTNIHRVAYDPKFNKYHISTTADKYREVHKWVSAMLEEQKFPFVPKIRPMKYGGDAGKPNYSAVFKDALSIASDTYDASTIQTTRTNAWKNRPPVAISYIPTVDAFPPLTTRKKQTPVTPSFTSEMLDEDTIQSAITVAINKLEEQHRAELTQLKTEMQQKIEAMEIQMKELGQQVAVQTYQALVKDESPLVTKKDHAHLQHELSMISTQLTTFINLFQKGDVSHSVSAQPASMPKDRVTQQSPARNTKRSKLNLTPVKLNLLEEAFTQEQSVSSATSTLDEGMEGCDD